MRIAKPRIQRQQQHDACHAPADNLHVPPKTTNETESALRQELKDLRVKEKAAKDTLVALKQEIERKENEVIALRQKVSRFKTDEETSATLAVKYSAVPSSTDIALTLGCTKSLSQEASAPATTTVAYITALGELPKEALSAKEANYQPPPLAVDLSLLPHPTQPPAHAKSLKRPRACMSDASSSENSQNLYSDT
jgi:hypothetical protein